jgi:hypothetical protein
VHQHALEELDLEVVARYWLAPATDSGATFCHVAWLAGWPTSAASQAARRQGAVATPPAAGACPYDAGVDFQCRGDRDQGKFIGARSRIFR